MAFHTQGSANRAGITKLWRWHWPPDLGTLFLLGAVFSIHSCDVTAAASDIKSDELVIFFPTAGKLSEDGRNWHIPVHGWIFEPEQDDVLRTWMLNQIRRAANLEADPPSARIFEERLRWFLVDNERGKRLGIRIGDQTFVLAASGRDGHFSDSVSLPVEVARRLARNGRLGFEAVTRSGDDRRFRGVVHLVGRAGISVVSDIDDTVKLSQVTDKRQLMRNTFFRPFRQVEGMAQLYRQWADRGVQFHFVSNSPWQLYRPLSQFLEQEVGFPQATYHLKQFRLKDSSIQNLFADPLEAKLQLIEPLLRSYPSRRFLLIGDSGERDPEVYGDLARKYPQQVLRIYIRDVTGESASGRRYQSAFRHLAREQWQLFRDPRTLPLPSGSEPPP